jgi:beta-glucosidase
VQTANDVKEKINELLDSQFTCPFMHPSLEVAWDTSEEIVRRGHRPVLEWSASAVLAIGGAFVVLFPHANAQTANSKAERPAYMNPALSADERAVDLVFRMTVEEKASQVVHRASAIPRLGVPAYNWWTEALHGVAAGTATVFPEPIGLASTFDSPLIHDVGVIIGTEARAEHNEEIRHGIFTGVGLDFWAPNLNIFRDPRWGRGQETYGEDPYLTARMGVAYVTGMQGDDPKYLRVIATPKHYAVHSGPEPLRHEFDAKVSMHDLEDTYLPAFRAAVIDGKAGSVMCVYNSVNGEPGCANRFLLGNQLRDQWKFKGYVVSDCDAVFDIERGHHFVKTHEEAAAISMIRGTDLDCNDPGDDYQLYLRAVKEGLLPEKDLDRSVERLMRARFQLGMFDPPSMVKYAQIPLSENDSEEHRVAALKVARESMVLLKNAGVLPLEPNVKSIAVIGPLADDVHALLGNYHGTASRVTTALDGIKKVFPNTKISFALGTTFVTDSSVPIPPAMLTTEEGEPGLKAEYFKGVDLRDVPVVVRIDKNVDFDFRKNPPSQQIGAENFSARWTGFLTPSESGTYSVGALADDGYRVWLDGKLLVDDWYTHSPTRLLHRVSLVKGHRYSIKMEYFQEGADAVAQLLWSKQAETAKSSEQAAESAMQERAIEAAKQADVIVAVVGITADLEGEEMDVHVPGFEGGDRTDLGLPRREEELLMALHATGKPLVVVLMNGSSLAINWADKNAAAILEAWYPGEEGGQAIAETLVGTNNPGGRLPVTFYTGLNQLPSFTDYSMKERTYRYFHGEPLYSFGFGLSYARFVYSNLQLGTRNLDLGQSQAVDVDVRNVSAVGGDEVTQVYLTFPAVKGAPIKALRGFTRVYIPAGETRHLHFTLGSFDLSVVNESGVRMIPGGEYRLSVGGSQPTSPFGGEAFSVKHETLLSDEAFRTTRH